MPARLADPALVVGDHRDPEQLAVRGEDLELLARLRARAVRHHDGRERARARRGASASRRSHRRAPRADAGGRVRTASPRRRASRRRESAPTASVPSPEVCPSTRPTVVSVRSGRGCRPTAARRATSAGPRPARSRPLPRRRAVETEGRQDSRRSRSEREGAVERTLADRSGEQPAGSPAGEGDAAGAGSVKRTRPLVWSRARPAAHVAGAERDRRAGPTGRARARPARPRPAGGRCRPGPRRERRGAVPATAAARIAPRPSPRASLQRLRHARRPGEFAARLARSP